MNINDRVKVTVGHAVGLDDDGKSLGVAKGSHGKVVSMHQQTPTTLMATVEFDVGRVLNIETRFLVPEDKSTQ